MASSQTESDGNFQDPLENYDPKVYSDPLEAALAEHSVGAIKHRPFSTISADTLVRDAVAKLAGLHVACLLVAKGKELVGIFSDRDVLNRVALDYGAVESAPVSQVMTKDPVFVYESDSAAAALCVMAVSGYRHVPVLDSKQELVGIVSPQRVTNFLLGHAEVESDG